jgi:hypothetical protein
LPLIPEVQLQLDRFVGGWPVKLSFRATYSLFDKIAFFLNAYLGLNIPEKRVSFRGVWYEGQEKRKGIRREFQSLANWPLRGLFWLGKDLYEDAPEFRAAIDPEAQRLCEIRNQLEHNAADKLRRFHCAGILAQIPVTSSGDACRGWSPSPS